MAMEKMVSNSSVGMAGIWGLSLGRWGKNLRAAEQLVPSVMGCLFLPVEDI